MKRLLIIGCILFAIIVVSFYFFRTSQYWSQVIEMDGHSMSEYGLDNGVNARVYTNQKCQVGDFCEFQCVSEKCSYEGSGYTAVKKVVSIENGCYFFEGNKNSWKDDEHPGKVGTSYDSHVFGCLTPDEFTMKGVVRK